MLRPAGRLLIRMAEVPWLTGLDESADELPVNVLRSEAVGAAGASHGSRRDHRRPTASIGAVHRVRVQRSLERFPAEPLTHGVAEALVSREGDKVAVTPVALADAERDTWAEGCAATAAGTTEPLVAVHLAEQSGAAPARHEPEHDYVPAGSKHLSTPDGHSVSADVSSPR